MKKNIFKGLGVALITPFTEDGAVDYDSLEKLIDMHLVQGTDFLCILGTTAETPCLNSTERQQIIEFIVKKVNGRLPLLLGCGGNNTEAIAAQLKNDDFNGIDGILSVCPYYNKPSQEGLYQHFKTLSEATKLPLVLYNVPGRTGVNLEASTTLRLANDCANIVAIKEASGKISQIEEIIKNKPEGFDVLSGDDGITYELLLLGAAGVISVIANAYPQKFGTMVHNAIEQNVNSALQIHREYTDLFKLLSVDGNPAGIKALMSEMGLVKNRLRLPLVSAREETIKKIRSTITESTKKN